DGQIIDTINGHEVYHSDDVAVGSSITVNTSRLVPFQRLETIEEETATPNEESTQQIPRGQINVETPQQLPQGHINAETTQHHPQGQVNEGNGFDDIPID